MTRRENESCDDVWQFHPTVSCHILGPGGIVRHNSLPRHLTRYNKMARTGAVAAVVLGTVLALTQFEAALATPVSANVHTSGFSGSSSGAAQSQVVENDGTIKGECAYVGPDGNTIKISYRQPPNGQLQAESNTPGVDPAAALATCRRAAEAASIAAQQNFQQVQEMILRSIRRP
ncbi:uncharacterized protein LOC126986990 isoform X2 [Eriocheir sinensis]|uniref:uncharacterized protein LOC126986990 isoform X2 n=1 Tax=Eriocheir sinensis TaxID=95602 RepID=UPI0021C787BD|nr:uncharacterized protein LOC126986990 isoform X2 [Eriocheir sinensis]